VRELMGRWNRFMLARRPEPLIYEAWIWELQRGLLAERLGDELFYDMATPRVPLLMRILRDRQDWCDNPRTPARESCDDAIAAALDRALDWIARRQGNDIDTWQWGIEHPAAHRHPFFDAIPLLRDVASVRFPSDGGGHTLNRATPSFRGRRPFEAVHGASYRAVYDFSDLDNSRFAIPLGQSGNMLSRWSTSFVENWRALRYVEIAGTRAELARSAVGVITLNPAR
jgi:penicillin amidase